MRGMLIIAPVVSAGRFRRGPDPTVADGPSPSSSLPDSEHHRCARRRGPSARRTPCAPPGAWRRRSRRTALRVVRRQERAGGRGCPAGGRWQSGDCARAGRGGTVSRGVEMAEREECCRDSSGPRVDEAHGGASRTAHWTTSRSRPGTSTRSSRRFARRAPRRRAGPRIPPSFAPMVWSSRSRATPISPDVLWCPMHPDVRAASPGKCPICSMDLVPDPAAASRPVSRRRHAHRGGPRPRRARPDAAGSRSAVGRAGHRIRAAARPAVASLHREPRSALLCARASRAERRTFELAIDLAPGTYMIDGRFPAARWLAADGAPRPRDARLGRVAVCRVTQSLRRSHRQGRRRCSDAPRARWAPGSAGCGSALHVCRCDERRARSRNLQPYLVRPAIC